MSGNQRRTRAQKHQNKTAWKADKNKTDPKTKIITNMHVSRCCPRCTDIITWKINYGKYKPLTRPATCTRCHNKTVRHAYHTICFECVDKLGVCAKCGIVDGSEEVERNLINQASNVCVRLRKEIETELKNVSERQRRGVKRRLERLTDLESTEELEVLKTIEIQVKEFVRKRKERRGELDDDDFDDDFDDFGDSEEEDEEGDEEEEKLEKSVGDLKLS